AEDPPAVERLRRGVALEAAALEQDHAQARARELERERDPRGAGADDADVGLAVPARGQAARVGEQAGGPPATIYPPARLTARTRDGQDRAMSSRVRRLVTEIEASGRARFASDGTPPFTVDDAASGYAVSSLWQLDAAPTSPASGGEPTGGGWP